MQFPLSMEAIWRIGCMRHAEIQPCLVSFLLERFREGYKSLFVLKDRLCIVHKVRVMQWRHLKQTGLCPNYGAKNSCFGLVRDLQFSMLSSTHEACLITSYFADSAPRPCL